MSPRTPPDELDDGGAGVETAGPAYGDEQLELLAVPQDVGERCSMCLRRDRTTRGRGSFLLCDWCAARGGGRHG